LRERERNEKHRDNNQGNIFFLDRKRFRGKLSLKPKRTKIEKGGERKPGE
jgi:hypothetical protein